MVRPFQGRFPISRLFLLVAAFSLLSPLAAIAARYPDPPFPTGSFVFLSGNPTVNGAPVDVGDEIAAYSVHPKPGGAGKTFEKVLIGHGVVTVAGQLGETPAYGDDNTTTGAVEGAVPGEEICLVLWRASEGKEYTAYLDGAGGAGKAVWTSNLATVTVNVDFVDGQRIPLRNNAWNLFAYSVLSGYDNVMPTQPQLSGVVWHGVANLGEALPLKSIAGKYVRVLGNDGLVSKFWDPALPTFSTLKSMSSGYGYWIKMKADAGGLPLSWMTVAGGRTTGSESLALGVGWTQVGYWGDPIYHLPTYDALSDLYPVDASDNVAIPSMGQMWSSIDTRYVRMLSFDAWGAKAYLPLTPTFSTLKSMGPGYGYWVKMSTAGTLLLPSRTVPSGVRAVAGDNQVTLSWLAVPGATSYNLYWGTSPGVTKATGTQIPGVASPYVHTGRTNGTPYYYIVTAVVGGVEGSASAEVSATPEAVSLAPSITTFSPSSGIAGDNVTIVGENFTVSGTTVAFFNGVPATVVSNTGTVLEVAVPPGAATGAITVTTSAGSASTASPFTVITTPAAPTGVSAAAGIYQVTLTWSPSSGATSYRVYWATFPSVSKGSNMGMIDNATSPLVHSPLSAGVPYYYVVTAINRAGESADSSPVASATPFVAPPTITGFAPPSGAAGDSVTITGTNFDPVAFNNDVRFNGTQAVVTGATATQIVAIVPAGPGTSGRITVTTAGGTATSSSDFTVTSPGYSISGTVSYPGLRTGRIYLDVFWNGGGVTGYGVSIAGPGAFTIRGVPSGSYVLRAFRDTQGSGTQVASSPTGSSGTVTVSGGNVPGVSVTLSDPGTVTPVSPASVSAIPGNGCALVFLDRPRNGNGVEIAQSYNLYWSTSPSVSPSSFTGRKQGILAPRDNYVQWGLTNGTALYYVATAVADGVESLPSPVFGPVTIGAPAGGTTVSGTVSAPGVTPTGPLYVALGPGNSSPLYIAVVGSPTNSQAYAVSGVQPGTYSVFAILDMNQDNTVGLGDIMNTDAAAPQITVGGSPVSGADATLSGANAIASVETSHYKSGTIESYGISPRVDEHLKQVVNVAITQGTSLPVPVDMGKNGNERYIWVGSPRPNIGDNYVFTVSYSDNTSETLSALVTGVLDSFATPTYPVGTVSGPSALTPTFTWSPPASPPASYTYGLWLGGPSGNVWEVWSMPSTQTSAAYNFDGTASLGTLAYGVSYNWSMSVRDAYRNQAQNYASFTVTAPSPPTISGFSPGSGSAGDPVTITGTNFDTVPANNTVRFAGTQATVTSATATQIVALVPAGAVSGAISVTTDGGTASFGSFTVIVTISFTGKVVDFAGAPVSGALIERVGAPSNNTSSLGDGTFVLTGIPGGTPFSLKVSKATYVPTYSSSILTGSDINATATPFTLYTPAQLTGWGVTPGKGIILGTVVNGATLAPVEGAVVTASSSLHPGTPYAVTYSTGTGFGGAATFANGIFAVLNTDDGDTVTIGTTRSGWTFSSPVAGSHADSATLVMVRGTVTPPSPAYSISGTVSYSGSRTGRVYLNVMNNGGGEAGYGVSLAGPGAFTIRGVPPGSYVVQAFRDTQGNGTQVGFSPTGSSGTVTVSGGNVLGVNITLSDPGTVTPVSPSSVSAIPGNGCALVFFDGPRNGNGVEIAQSYNLYWSTSASVSPSSFTGRRQGILAPGDNYTQRGLTNGTVLYYVATAVSGGVESAPSPVFGPVTIGAPAGGTTVSGTVSVPGVATLTGPLYVAVGPVNSKPLYIAVVGSPANPQAYTVSGVQPGTYSVYAILDMDQDNVIGLGDIRNTDGGTAPQITVGGSPVSGANVTLGGGNAVASVETSHYKSGAIESYSISPRVDEQRKLVTNVTVTQGTYLPVPVDMGRRGRDGYNVWVGSPRPNIGDNYVFTVSYSDNTSETLSALVTAVLDSFATPTHPVGVDNTADSTTPTFTWTAPGSPPATYTYSLWMNGSGAWWYMDNRMPSTQTSVLYNVDGNASNPSLTIGTTYNWTITVNDAAGNQAQYQTNFIPGTPIALPSPTITSFTPDNGVFGTVVTINGSNFDNTASVYFFNNVLASSRTVVSTSQIDATVPSGASTGVIKVTTAGGTATSGSAFTIPLPPSPPAGVSALGVNGAVVVSWTGGVGATTFKVYRGGSPGVTKLTGSVVYSGPGGVRQITDNGVVNGTPYYYVVTASNVNGESVESMEVSATPTSGMVLGGPAPYLQKRQTGTGSVVLRSWIDMKDPATGISLEYTAIVVGSGTVTGGGGPVPLSSQWRQSFQYVPLDNTGTPVKVGGVATQPTPSDLPTGFYRVSAQDNVGRTYVRDAWYDNSVVSPGTVDNATMSGSWNVDGSLTFTWDKPSGMTTTANPSVQMRAVIMTTTDTNGDGVAEPVYYSPNIPLNDSVTTYGATVDNASMTYLKGLYLLENMVWHVEVRHNRSGYEVYRHNSIDLRLPSSGAGFAAYAIAGTVSGGSGSGRIYLNVQQSGGGTTGYGTSVEGPGSYRIRGVPPGSYVVTAYRDLLGTGMRNAADPAGTWGTVNITTGNVTGANVTLSDPSPFSPSTPGGVTVVPGDGAALVLWNTPTDGSGREIAASYNLYWSTSPSVSPTTFTGSAVGIKARNDAHYFASGLSNGSTYYYVVTASLLDNVTTSAPSAVSAPAAIGVPVGGHTISGTVTFPGVTATGPLYIALVPGGNGMPAGAAWIPSPTSPQAFSVSGVPDGTYGVYAILDQDNNHVENVGDLSNTDGNAPVVTVSGGNVTGVSAPLPTGNAQASVRTSHWTNGSTDSYSVTPAVSQMRKLPVKVVLAGGPNVPPVVDIGKGDWQEFSVWINTPRPNVGDNYVLNVTYSDNTTEVFVRSVTTVLDSFPTPTHPVGVDNTADSTTPTFTWTAPGSPPATYTYNLWMGGPDASWSTNDRMPSTQTSALYNFDGNASSPSLTMGNTYNWTITVSDAAGNQAQRYTSFTPVSGSTPGIPTAPSQLTGVGADGLVKLRWWNTAGGYPVYRVYRGATPGLPRGSRTLLGELQSTAFTDNGLVNTTTYYYTVTAVTEGGESADSAEIAVAPQGNTYLAQLGYVQKRPVAVLRYFIAMLDPVTGAGIPVANLDNASMTVTGPGGGVATSTKLKWVSYYAPLSASGTPTPNTGITGALSSPGGELPTGFYILRVSDTLGRNYVWSTWYDNTTVPLVVVDNTTMSATYTLDGSLRVSWNKQAGISVSNYPGGVHYRVVAYTRTDRNGDGQVDEVYISPQISISDGQSSYTHVIDNESLTYFRGYLGGFPITEFYWQVETRVYRNGNEVYRANSGIKDLPGSQVIDKFVQLRVEADGQQVYHVFAQVSRPFGVPMAPSEFSSISLVDNTAATVPLAGGTTEYIYSPYYFLDANSPATVVNNVLAGARAHLSAPVGTLPIGNYTVRLTDTSAITYTSVVNYPGDEVLPGVDNATMLGTLNPDGSVTLSWLTPAGMDGTMQFRVVVASNTADRTGDGLPDDLLYAKTYFLSPGATNTQVVPSSMVSAWRAAYASGELRWHVQTRKYNSANINYSRTYSGTRVFPLP